MTGTCNFNSKTATVSFHVWVLVVALSRPVLSATADDPRCSPSGFTLAYPTIPAWYTARDPGRSTAGFNVEVDEPNQGYAVGDTRKLILGGRWAVHLATGPDAATISPQAIGFDFVSNIKFQTVTAVTTSLIYYDGASETYLTGVIVFPDFPQPGANSTITYAGHSITSETAVTGGTNAFMGITGEYVSSSSGNTGLITFRYANRFKPVC